MLENMQAHHVQKHTFCSLSICQTPCWCFLCRFSAMLLTLHAGLSPYITLWCTTWWPLPHKLTRHRCRLGMQLPGSCLLLPHTCRAPSFLTLCAKVTHSDHCLTSHQPLHNWRLSGLPLQDAEQSPMVPSPITRGAVTDHPDMLQCAASPGNVTCALTHLHMSHMCDPTPAESITSLAMRICLAVEAEPQLCMLGCAICPCR